MCQNFLSFKQIQDSYDKYQKFVKCMEICSFNDYSNFLNNIDFDWKLYKDLCYDEEIESLTYYQ